MLGSHDVTFYHALVCHFVFSKELTFHVNVLRMILSIHTYHSLPLISAVFPQTVPVLAGVGVVAVTAILAKIFLPGLFGGKKKGAPTTLKDATVKYPLKLIDREVSIYNPHADCQTNNL